MNENFGKSLQFVLKHEGGYSNIPGDNGGATNLGIIQSEYNLYRAGLGEHPRSVREITVSEATFIYSSKYWMPMHGDFVAWSLDIVLFDSAVNCGVGRTTTWLNFVLGCENEGEKWNEVTSKYYHREINQNDERHPLFLANSVLNKRTAFYNRLAFDYEHDQQFLEGWINRVTDLWGMINV